MFRTSSMPEWRRPLNSPSPSALSTVDMLPSAMARMVGCDDVVDVASRASSVLLAGLLDSVRAGHFSPALLAK